MANRNYTAACKLPAPDYRAAIRRVIQMTPAEENKLVEELQDAARSVPGAGYSSDAIRAYLASVRPPGGVEFLDEIEEQMHSGRSLIDRLALSAHGGDDPTLQLSRIQWADVLAFVQHSQPRAPKTWWEDPEHGASHVVGFLILIRALEESLRAKGKRS